MTNDLAMVISSEMMWTAIKVCAPILGFTMLVGLMISIFQVITQIQEMSLAFIPKLFTVAISLIVLGPWMLSMVVDFSRNLIANIPNFF